MEPGVGPQDHYSASRGSLMDAYDRTRVLIAKHPEESLPYIVGAHPEPWWENMGVDDWDAWKRERGEAVFGPEWTAYEYIEVVITLPSEQLSALFAAREIVPTTVERSED